jgi:hypothetical protein
MGNFGKAAKAVSTFIYCKARVINNVYVPLCFTILNCKRKYTKQIVRGSLYKKEGYHNW